jgi:hypothetical protein
MKKTITLLLSTVLLLSTNFILAQDLPTTAVELTVGLTSADFPVIVSNVDATNSFDTDPTIPNPSCASYQGGDSWYLVVVPANGAVQMLTTDIGGGVSDTGMSVYEGTADALIEVACNDDVAFLVLNSQITLTGRVPGETLFVRVFSYQNASFGEFELAAFELNIEPPVNDNVAGAIELNVGDSFSDFSLIGNNTDATNSEVNDPTIPFPTCSLYDGGDMWYYIDVSSQDAIYVETALETGGIEDTGVAIYRGEVGAFTQIACNDDDGDNAFSFITLMDLIMGERLYVRVFEYNNDNFGEFQISAHSNIAETPPNDDPIGAISLTVAGTFEDGAEIATNEFATNSGAVDPALEDPSCIFFFEGGDVWYTAEVPNSGNLTIQTGPVAGSGFGDSVLSVYEGNKGTLSEIDCNDDSNFSLFSKIELTGRTPGEVVYIRTFHFDNSVVGEFEISAYDDIVDGVEDNNFIEGLTISPNPVQSNLNLKSVSPIGNVKVFNLVGERVLDVNLSSSDYQLDVSTITNGTYLIQVNVGQQIATYKFIKI